MRYLYKYIILLALIMLVTWARKCAAAEYSLMLPHLSEMDIEYFRYHGQYRDPYFVDDQGQYIQMRDGAAVNFTLSLLGPLYWKNRIHMDNDARTNTPRHVGWDWEGGIHVPYLPLDIYQHHHSRHGLEYQSPYETKFPVEDSYGIRLQLIGGPEHGN